jgi:hypothetical protein
MKERRERERTSVRAADNEVESTFLKDGIVLEVMESLIREEDG